MEYEKLIEIVNYCLNECKKTEMPWCEFKQNFHSSDEIWKNISAISNISRILNRPNWYIIFWVESENHSIIWTDFDYNSTKWKWNEDLIPWLIRKLGWFIGFEFFEIENFFENKRVIICIIEPSLWNPISFDDVNYIRIGTYTKPIKENKELESKLWESLLMSSFDKDIAISRVNENQLFELIDWEWYCKNMNYEPITKQTVKEKLLQDNLIIFKDWLFDITNACALLFAKDLEKFGLKNKSPRVITYRWNNKLHAINDQKWSKWYVMAFPGLINFIISQIPKIEIIESTRINDPLYPKVALREFIANAIIHQDLRMNWSEVLIEIYDDRVEISNPWIPLIDIDRFVDHPPKSRNEILADFMRRANLCEKRWSWVDRALESLKIQKLPNPKIEKSSDFTRVIMYRTRPITKLTNDEKSQAVYWHCVLVYVLENEAMTNESVCDRFWIEKQNSAIASRLIKLAKESWKIKPFDPNSNQENMQNIHQYG